MNHPAIPEDLRAWFPESALVRLVLEAVTSSEVGQDRLLPMAEGEETFAPGMMLSLLTYSYVTGRFGSDEVEAALRSDPNLAYLAARRSPTAATFRRFRRRHSDLLNHVLAQLLIACLNGRAAAADVSRLSAVPTAPTSVSLSRLAQQNACSRIQRAVLEDTVAADV